jgi:hypothetical protein
MKFKGVKGEIVKAGAELYAAQGLAFFKKHGLKGTFQSDWNSVQRHVNQFTVLLDVVERRQAWKQAYVVMRKLEVNAMRDAMVDDGLRLMYAQILTENDQAAAPIIEE